MTLFVYATMLHARVRIDWTNWSVHWSTVTGLAALGALYVWAMRKQRDDRSQLPTPNSALFLAGLLVIFVSLNGPLHDLSDHYLFSAHMVQHLLLTMLAPPLLIAGTRGWMLRPVLRHRRVFAAARWLTKPTRAFVIFNVVIAAWHLPPLYNAAMATHAIHIAQHLTFIAAAVLMWWPFLSPLPELPRLAYPGQMLYCFLMSIPMSIVAIFVAMADHILYPAYSSAPRLWGLSPLADQQIGGLIMWIPGGLFFYGVMTVVFFKWAARDTDHTAGAQVDFGGSRIAGGG